MSFQELKPLKKEALTCMSLLLIQIINGGAEKPQNPFGPNMIAFTSPEDMMKNLPNAMGNLSRAMGGGGMLTDSPTFKRSMREYEDMV
jgi:hypothetical protein